MVTGVDAIVAEIRALGSERNRAGMARYGINTSRAFGVSMSALTPIAKRHRRDHALALALWKTGWHEARILATMIADPKSVTPAQMDRWAGDFDSWDVCDQACMKLFARTPFVTEKVRQWAADEREFVRRAAFALIAGYTVHAKEAPDGVFLNFLPIIETHAADPRNYVKKAVNWALRQIGKRSLALHGPAHALALRLAAADDPIARWIGRDAAKELSDPARITQIEAKSRG
jgi:3-methyladenine DNA glycosylase AlkD